MNLADPLGLEAENDVYNGDRYDPEDGFDYGVDPTDKGYSPSTTPSSGNEGSNTPEQKPIQVDIKGNIRIIYDDDGNQIGREDLVSKDGKDYKRTTIMGDTTYTQVDGSSEEKASGEKETAIVAEGTKDDVESTGGSTDSVDMSNHGATTSRTPSGDEGSEGSSHLGSITSKTPGNEDQKDLSIEKLVVKVSQEKSPVENKKKKEVIGRKLPDSGVGFDTYNPADYSLKNPNLYGDDLVIETIIQCGLAWLKKYKIKFYIGDISKKGGGSLSGHPDHTDGLDIDIKYIIKDGSLPSGNYGSGYDRAKTIKLIEEISKTADSNGLNIEYVIFGDKNVYKDKKMKNINFLTKKSLLDIHKNHIHIRFKYK